MSVVHILDSVTEWVRANICEEVKLKAPPESEKAPTDSGYDYQLVTPAAFPLYVPAKDKTPPGVLSPLPSVCVRFLEGSESLTSNSGTIGLQLYFCTWDPGLHSKDIYLPNGDGSFKLWTGEEAEEFFRKSGGGWRDAWNFVDVALRKLGNTVNVGGCPIDRSVPIKYGPLTEQGEIVEAYPLWFAWVSFSVNYNILRNTEDILKYL